jgi:predicted nucleotidyltransferase
VATWSDLEVETILERLTARGVDFVVIGGIAAALLGSPRLTQDLDVCFAVDSANLKALGRALVDLDARLGDVADEVPFVPDEATLRRVEVLTLETRAGRLDVLARPRGAPSYQSLRRRAERFDVGGFSVLVAGLEDLIAMKLAAGRAKDIADVEELEAIRRLRKRESGMGQSERA